MDKKYSHRRCPSDCQRGHLTNFFETHHQKRSEQARPLCHRLCYCCPPPLFKKKNLFIISSQERSEYPWVFSAVKCAHDGDARCVQTAPTDRQTHPAAFPASPLLHPSTSVTLTVKAHLSICCSNCSPGWLSFRRRPVPRTHTHRRGASCAWPDEWPVCKLCDETTEWVVPRKVDAQPTRVSVYEWEISAV